ncbi:MAG: carboxypeptidase-like regulatory domain-containing protein, partial [Rhodanobacteraceae bacterium]
MTSLRREPTTSELITSGRLATKYDSVAQLLDNVERASKLAVGLPLPLLIPAQMPRELRSRIAVREAQGGRCDTAVAIDLTREIDAIFAGANQPGSELWLKVRPANAGIYAIDTGATPLDTDIAVFAHQCPHNSDAAIAYNDDAFGVAARSGLDARTDHGPWYVRVRNLGSPGLGAITFGAAGQITGRIADERNGEPLAAQVVALYPDGSDGSFPVYTDELGNYTLDVSPPGSYYVEAGAYDFLTELYPDAECSGPVRFGICDLAHAQLIEVDSGATVSGIDLQLNVGGRVAGVVADRDSGARLPGTMVTIESLDHFYNPLSVYTDASGRYVGGPLASGSYRVQADAAGHGSQVWDHVDCLGPVQ